MLHGHANCTKYIHEFLDLIQTEMIIIRRKDPELSRIGTGALTGQLLELFQGCKDVKFALEKVPRAYVPAFPFVAKSRKIKTF